MWTMMVEPTYVMVPPGSARRPKITGCITKGESLEQGESVPKGIQTSSFRCG
jgi:hypothetical protein